MYQLIFKEAVRGVKEAAQSTYVVTSLNPVFNFERQTK